MSKLTESNKQALHQWYIGGLQAMISANKIGEKTTEKLKEYVTSKDLLKAIDEGSNASEEHVKIVKELLQEAGGEKGEITNEIMKGIYEATDNIAESKDDNVKDLGVIASAQIALHYYIAAYGGLASTAAHLGLKDQSDKFSELIEELKTADENYSKLAESN